MNTAAAIFFLVLGQADGQSYFGTTGSAGGGLVVIPSHYTSLADCEDAGEAARANNLGLSYLSYTCVPGEINVEGEAKTLIESVSKGKTGLFAMQAVKAGLTTAVPAPCLEVCEVQ